MTELTGEAFLLALFALHTDVVAHHQVVGALHEAGELAATVCAKQVGTGFGDENVVLTTGYGFLDKKELVARVNNDGLAVLHS